MVSYVARRLGAGIILVLGSSLLVFLLMLVNSEHIARIIMGDEASDEAVAHKAAALGLDHPVIVQYWDWLGGTLKGDLGTSWLNGESVTYLLVNRIPVTLSVAVGTIVVSCAVSVVLGLIAAVRRGWVDRVLQAVSVLGLVFPGFWLALVLVSVVAIQWGLVPATGYTPMESSIGGWLSSLALPVFSLAFGAVSGLAQQVRSATIATLDRDFVRTLRSRGIPERTVLLRHVLRNAAPPTLTVLSLNFIGLMSGAVMIEQVFALPGIGSLAVEATTKGDIPIVMGAVIISVLIVVVVNVLTDLLNGWLNPKVRLS
ncbi:ABC transporter permease [Streptomyces sp. NBC_01754]|uniref:ABC transporter permease n=1 Tax=Streptomyces sp. NBC_01754 TaxID=2975930 RepID=UPI002DDB4830|nr:ABC transporter permease [Streptomyces sp. NBC_01754]WSC96148.1 ABC transporter permease [Streptomyces sp. NBC_01754]